MSETNNDLMSEFRKLQSETTGIRSLFAEKSSLDTENLIVNKLARDIHDFCEKTIELQDKFNKEVMDEVKSQKTEIEDTKKEILKELRLMRSDLEMVKEKVEEKPVVETKFVEKDEEENPKKLVDSHEDPPIKSTEKEFVLRHVFKNISKRKLIEYQNSGVEEHFNYNWNMFFWVENDQFCLYVTNSSINPFSETTVDAEVEMKIISENGEIYCYEMDESFTNGRSDGWNISTCWMEIMENFINDDKLVIEVSVKINGIYGKYKYDSMCFDESMKAFSDILLIVDGRQFYVYKLMHLATQSSYFKSLKKILKKSKISEVSIPDIDPDDFHVFLEVLYGEDIDESTVEICLLLAERFDAQTTTRRCEEFLMDESEKTLKTKLRLAIRHQLEELKKTCLTEIKTMDDIRDVIPGDIRDLDPSFMAELFEKSLDF